MKIVHITEGAAWGGMEAHLYHLLPALQERENVSVECITLHRGLLAERLQARGVTTKVLPRKRKIDLSLFVRLFKYFHDSQVDIVHLHGYLAIIYGIPAAVAARIPVRIVTLHAAPKPLNGKTGRSKLKFYLWIAYSLIKKSTCYLIAVSDDAYRSHIKVRNISPDRMRVVHNGISVKEIQAYSSNIGRGDLNIPESHFLVGIVGRMDENKGHIYFLEAARNILSQRKDVNFVVIGNGPLESELKMFCRSSGMNGHIDFLGFQSNILDYLSIMDIIVISSLHEGIPYTLLEAMAKGVSVVATNVGGIPEVIKDSVNGLLIPAKDPKSIANCIMALLDNDGLRARLTEAGLEVLNQEFSQEAMADSTIAFYQNIRLQDLQKTSLR